MTTTTARSIRAALAVLAAAALGAALAAPPTFAATITPVTGGWPAVTFGAALPIGALDTREGPVLLGARLDATTPLDFSLPPAVALLGTAKLQFHDMFQPYLGAGASLGWRGTPGSQAAFVTPVAVAGLSVVIDGVWSPRVELMAAPLLGAYSLGLGVELAPW